MGFFKWLKNKVFSLDEQKVDTKQEGKDKEQHFKKQQELKQQKIEKKIIKTEKENFEAVAKKYYKKHNTDKYIAGLSKINDSFSRKIIELQGKYKFVNDNFYDDLEEILIMSDISANLVMIIVDEIKKEAALNQVNDPKEIAEILVDKMFMVYANRTSVNTTLNYKDGRLNVFIVIGVNGSGKTTSIAKLANSYVKKGKKVLVAAADTFRAGAVEQLNVWTNKIGCEIVKSEKQNADPASVVFKAIEKAKESNFDLLIIDTAGRLQNKVNLMNELQKIYKILHRLDENMPHECLLVLDSTTGQNGISQAREFNIITKLTGIILTKMDGTSKGGIALSIKDEFDIDVKLVGLGEGIEDLKEFDLDNYIYGMTKDLVEQ
ncbi:signal recognition particle-docking protein FtsY [Mycoplasma phocimorsus]|uniref:signal recognition particle-docking protein FtsY n=1 Tax=Mycoplasma phocimorsus TaxID=3045839 RepID=UPI0024BFA010|nr:signal recognition particle-docking protein FtsY [Mycoplasma phocimorsus]MDJ1647191.1 signal recognition particle-docking protein FtsY [Mycoplasma phocimorsus]